MKRLRFARDNGTDFYRELNERLDHYFESNNIPKTGDHKMIMKMILYFGLDLLFFSLMIASTSVAGSLIFSRADRPWHSA